MAKKSKFEMKGLIIGKEYKPAREESEFNGRKIPKSDDKFMLHVLVGERDYDKKLFYLEEPEIISAEVSLLDFAKVEDMTEVNCLIENSSGFNRIKEIDGMSVVTKDAAKKERLSSLLAAAGIKQLTKINKGEVNGKKQ